MWQSRGDCQRVYTRTRQLSFNFFIHGLGGGAMAPWPPLWIRFWLQEKVLLLRASVATLEAKVSYLLSFVGAVDCEPTPNLVQTPVDDNWTTVGHCSTVVQDQWHCQIHVCMNICSSELNKVIVNHHDVLRSPKLWQSLVSHTTGAVISSTGNMLTVRSQIWFCECGTFQD